MNHLKLNELCRIVGMSSDQLIQDTLSNAAGPGICVRPGCDATLESIEPDCDNGECPECFTDTVKSAPILAGII